MAACRQAWLGSDAAGVGRTGISLLVCQGADLVVSLLSLGLAQLCPAFWLKIFQPLFLDVRLKPYKVQMLVPACHVGQLTEVRTICGPETPRGDDVASQCS